MWTATLDYSSRRVLLMRLLSRFWPGVCFTSLSPLQVQNLPRPSLPADNWVRVRNRLAGVGGNDLRLIRGEGDTQIAPAALGLRHQTYPGHEVVGEVIEVGENVQRLRVGDRVILQYNPNCVSAGMQQLCHSCAAAEYNLCECALLPGPQPIGGGWSEEMLLHEQLLFPVAAELSDEQALILEPTSVALHALLRRPPQPGEQVLIIGAGTIGLLTLQLVRALVPLARVSVLARHSFQVEQATRMGAAHIIYPSDSYAGVQSATGAQRYQGVLGNRMLMGGYDVIYDTVGSNRTLHHALRWVRAQGTVVLVGIDPTFMRIDLSPLWFQQIGLLGSHSHGIDYWPIGTKNRQTTFSIVQQLLKEGLIHPEQLITQRFALNNYREALSTAMGKAHSRAIKVVFDYSLLPATVVPNVRASARRPRPAVVNSSTTPRRTATVDVGQDWPDIPVTPLPAPLGDEIESEDTAHALPVIPKSVTSSQHIRVTPQTSNGDRQDERQPLSPVHTTEGHEGIGQETEAVQSYIAEEDEATVVVRMTDVQAAYKAMDALESESGVQQQEPVEVALPSSDSWLPQEQAADVEAEPGSAEEQTVEVAELEEAAEEPQADSSVVESDEEQQASETSTAGETEQPFEQERMTGWPKIEEMGLPETASEEPSQASQREEKTTVARQHMRQRSGGRRSKSKDRGR
jgi:threonine dehydrogenase-like Zn-dependent dehydrogenase